MLVKQFLMLVLSRVRFPLSNVGVLLSNVGFSLSNVGVSLSNVCFILSGKHQKFIIDCVRFALEEMTGAFKNLIPFVRPPLGFVHF